LGGIGAEWGGLDGVRNGESPWGEPAGRTILTPRVVARISACLYLSCGALVALVTPLLPMDRGANRAGTVLIGVLAAACGVLIWRLPWERWPERTTLVLAPVAFVMILGFNWFARDPYLYDLFFLVVFVWVGLAHPKGTSVLCAPMMAAAYLVPLWAGPPAPHGDLAGASLVYVLPVCLVVGEAVAWGAGRLRVAEAARARSEARYAALVQNASEFVSVLDEGGLIRYASPSTIRVLGLAPETLVGRPSGELIHPDDLEVVSSWFQRAHSTGDAAPATYRVRAADGSYRWVEGIITDLRGDPNIAGILVNGRDVTERVRVEHELSHSAHHDSLTGLPNRSAFHEDLQAALERSTRHGTAVAVLFLDLDGFKVINDSLGHASGDRLLSSVARRLETQLRKGDRLSRLGGDELVIIMENVVTDREVLPAAQRILDRLTDPFFVDGRRLVVTASMGVTVGRGPGVAAEDLLREADLAMYLAKEKGRNRFEVFDRTLARQARRRMDVEAGLRVALERHQFVLHYQPEVELPTGRIVGQEALLRWHHPERGLTAPGEFIPVAEDTGLIVPIGRWVLREACRQAAVWRRDLGDGAPHVSVNVSVRQLREETFVQEHDAGLRETGLPPGALRLEVTESIFADPTWIAEVLGELKALGVELAIDDFGTGYSSLSYLHQLPVDVIKIDRSFLAAVDDADDRAPLVEATIALAHSLDLLVVAEGVERPRQAELLVRAGCPRAQGFLYGRPSPSGGMPDPTVVAVG
jgi:diguanylate cyclase (GGDEF)-like protein/PAS domain S-box-containing protein